jgi:hypothetical protein
MFCEGRGVGGGSVPVVGGGSNPSDEPEWAGGGAGPKRPFADFPGREAGWAGKSTSARKLKEDGFLDLHASSGAPSSGCRRCAGYVCPFSAPVSDLCPHIRHGRRAGAGKVRGEMEAEGEMLRGTFMLPRLRTVSPTYKRR